MNDNVKHFIELNSELLDTNLKTFLAKGIVKLRGTWFEELVSVLEASNINFTEEREQLLINKLSFIFPIVEDGTTVSEVVKDHLLSYRTTMFFGLTLQELIDFIEEHEQSWSDDMWIESFNGILKVRTRE